MSDRDERPLTSEERVREAQAAIPPPPGREIASSLPGDKDAAPPAAEDGASLAANVGPYVLGSGEIIETTGPTRSAEKFRLVVDGRETALIESWFIEDDRWFGADAIRRTLVDFVGGVVWVIQAREPDGNPRTYPNGKTYTGQVQFKIENRVVEVLLCKGLSGRTARDIEESKPVRVKEVTAEPPPDCKAEICEPPRAKRLRLKSPPKRWAIAVTASRAPLDLVLVRWHLLMHDWGNWKSAPRGDDYVEFPGSVSVI